MISNCILVVSWLAAAHLDLCTEAIALLFQRIHFSFLSCHGDGCSGMLLTGNETLKREGDKQRERKQSVRCWSLGTARMNNSRSELFTRWEHLSSRSSSIIQSINKSEQTSPAGILLPSLSPAVRIRPGTRQVQWPGCSALSDPDTLIWINLSCCYNIKSTAKIRRIPDEFNPCLEL